MSPALAFIIPTYNRHADLHVTLKHLGELDTSTFDHIGSIEIIVVDNNSEDPAEVPSVLANNISARVIRLDKNHAAAARNIAAQSTVSPWIFMLDDDSSPASLEPVANAITNAHSSVAAIATTITLPGHTVAAPKYESGGLPAVPIGCSVLYRTRDFLNAQGYDPTFHYYVEEYDLAAKLIHANKCVAFEPRIRTVHRKVNSNRDFNIIIERLTRNNVWVIQRFAPEHVRAELVEHTLSRYEKIASKEGALGGYRKAVSQIDETLASQRRTPLSTQQFGSFTGQSHVVRHLRRIHAANPIRHALLCNPGKNAHNIEAALQEVGISFERFSSAHHQSLPSGVTLIPATLSPGPILSSAHELRVKNITARIELPWDPTQPLAGDVNGRAAPTAA